jgi:uncharacterized protein
VAPGSVWYKPAGVPLRFLSEVVLGLDEVEAIRLADVEHLHHADAAARMDVSRQTFDRILARARSRIALAITGGLAIRIETDRLAGVTAGHPRWREEEQP